MGCGRMKIEFHINRDVIADKDGLADVVKNATPPPLIKERFELRTEGLKEAVDSALSVEQRVLDFRSSVWRDDQLRRIEESVVALIRSEFRSIWRMRTLLRLLYHAIVLRMKIRLAIIRSAF